MGRGRAKAKQAKVARQLKYSNPDIDLDSLQRELSNKSDSYNDEESLYDQWADVIGDDSPPHDDEYGR